MPPSDDYVRSFLCSFFTVIKLLHKSSKESSLISGSKAKFSSLEATNLTPFTISYHHENTHVGSGRRNSKQSFKISELVAEEV